MRIVRTCSETTTYNQHTFEASSKLLIPFHLLWSAPVDLLEQSQCLPLGPAEVFAGPSPR